MWNTCRLCPVRRAAILSSHHPAGSNLHANTLLAKNYIRDWVASTFPFLLPAAIGCAGSAGCCGVDGKAACPVLFGVMQLVKVSRAGESLCYDELASGSCTGHLTGGLWVISVNTFQANIVILGSCSKKSCSLNQRLVPQSFLCYDLMLQCEQTSYLWRREAEKPLGSWGGFSLLPIRCYF